MPLPALGVVATKYPELAPFLSAVKEFVEVRDGRIGDPLERFVTLRDLSLADLLTVQRVGRSGTVLSPGGAVGAPDLTIPPIPTGMTASGAIQSIILDWTDPFALYGNHSYTEVWRADTDDLGAAVLVGQSPSFVWVDQVATGQTKYYWIRFVSTANIVGAFNSAAGTSATTGFLLTGDLADLAVTAGKIADAAVTGDKVAAAAIGNTQLAALAVDAANLADSAVTATKIANLAVGTAAIANAAVGSAQIANAAVGNAAIDNLAVGTAHLQDAAVVNAKIGALAVDSAKIADAAIVTAKIANANITTAKIAAANITTALIADANITTAKIVDANITTLKLAGQAVTIPVSAHTAAEVMLSKVAYTVIQTLSFTSTGAPVFIFATFMARPSSAAQAIAIRIMRGAVAIYGYGNVLLLGSNANTTFPYALSVIDTPGAGAVSYTLEAQYTNGSNDTYAGMRTMLALETKR